MRIMTMLFKAIILSILTGLIGIAAGLSTYGSDLEEDFGLSLLFSLRGTREAPSDVVFVALDRLSADNLGLPYDTSKWPRAYHAQIVQKLTSAGARGIVFDLTFQNETKDDPLFAQVIKKAGNVVMTEYIQKEITMLSHPSSAVTEQMDIEKIVSPTRLLAQASVALTAFPLPKIPERVNQFWAFKDGSWDFPTTPIIAFHLYAMQAYDDLILLLQKVLEDQQSVRRKQDRMDIQTLTQSLIALKKEPAFTDKNIHAVVWRLKEIFEGKQGISEMMLKMLENANASDLSPQRKQLLKSFVKMYMSEDSRYLNFYGPAGTITRVPYYQALQLPAPVMAGKNKIDFKGKVVFIGTSEILPYEQKDGFHTVFSQQNGLYLSGVEISATAFANLLEDFPVLPLSFSSHLFVLLLWGAIISVIWIFLSPSVAIGVTAGTIFIFVRIALRQFEETGQWIPIIVPIFIQTPLAVFSSVLWNYLNTRKESKTVRTALGYYLPDKIVSQLSQGLNNIKGNSQLVYGTILCTDVGGYTTLSELISPSELKVLINRYYEAICVPVKKHNGHVLDFKGDSMLAIWFSDKAEDVNIRLLPCLAAYDIGQVVDQFNQGLGNLQFQTRVGLHAGQVMLGNIGGGDRYHYTAVGDPVNTAARLEGLNKYMKTRLLVSDEVLDGLHDFLTRKIGEFVFAGKTKPLAAYELIGIKQHCTDRQISLCDNFTTAFQLYKMRQWSEALKKFSEILQNHDGDGPSLMYIKLCKKFIRRPPSKKEDWNGVINLSKK